VARECVKLHFVKMQGVGNDFVVLDGRFMSEGPWDEWSRRLLDRKFGVGGDQLLVLLSSREADVKMRIFERNGQESEMCGNGIRCVARYLFERGQAKKEYRIETLGGIKIVEVPSLEKIRVNMGVPVVDRNLWGREFRLADRIVKLHGVSMGNPHAVVFVERESDLELISLWGPSIENDALFPHRTNVELVLVEDPRNLKVRVWERGAGETLGCGTGACAVAVATLRERKAEAPISVQFRGGTLEVSWHEGEPVFMAGPAIEVFQGEIEL